MDRRLVKPRVAVAAAAHARPTVAELVLVDAVGRGHQRFLPYGPAAGGPGALRPRGRPAAFGQVLGSRGRCGSADVPVRRRRGRGGRVRHQAFRAARRREPERANGRRPAFELHLEQRVAAVVVLGRHGL